ncbi:hypothetical protein SAMN04488498_114122 [Mesorhizobium albiziae]|uniref:Permease n=1 Tax=Neomesorhizobium albiziae TaxID=335020 RepID=A0A1I4CUF6_9HYPH|nr:permease [Mesorhizobium albiziae]GLS31045.1 hypothetical protein GCM10007937_27540 [Mesorhizobium albiziae]SFK84892.1 hypothetical protein SAMN04488498_114122 [Mesorhizobium albiziae]
MLIADGSRNAGLGILIATTTAAVALIGVSWPVKLAAMLHFVGMSFVSVAPLIIIGLLLSAWMAATGAGTVAASLFQGRPIVTIIIASAVGAATPVCGVTVLPVMTGLLASGVPLAPVMAFWLSSPVTDPGMFAATWATLGPAFAIGKTAAAFGLGVFAGGATAALRATEMVRRPLRKSTKAIATCESSAPAGFEISFWRDAARIRAFWAELFGMTKVVSICLSLAFAAEYLLRDLLPPDVLGTYVGAQSAYAIPLTVSIGAPMYLDGYAALPLVRGLLDLGMDPGAALAFLVSGSAVSIWGVLAVVPILRAPTLALFVALAVLGSLACGYVFDWVWTLLP